MVKKNCDMSHGLRPCKMDDVIIFQNYIRIILKYPKMFTQGNTSLVIIVHQITCKVIVIDNSYVVIKE
jgi:hypothetical protein